MPKCRVSGGKCSSSAESENETGKTSFGNVKKKQT